MNFTIDPEQAKAVVQAFLDEPDDDSFYQHRKTLNRKDRVWKFWEMYAPTVKADPKGFWFEFLANSKQAKATCKAFLKIFLDNSTKKCVSLGPEEYKEVRSINCASTMEDIWASLIAVADKNIMLPMREKNPERADYYFLSYSSRFRGQSHKPAYEIARWIPQLAATEGLSLSQTFEKRETAPEDVILILDTFWTRANDIDCGPRIRHSFHCAVLLGAIGGWRPGSVINVGYADVKFAWVRDPNDPRKTRTVVDTTIYHVKQPKNRVQRDQRDRLTFTATRVVSCQLLSLIDFFTSRAIADGAFDAGYTTTEEVLHPEELEPGLDYVQLDWKPEMQNMSIVSISDSQYHRLWYLALVVAGICEEDQVRRYAMRVGTGGKLDGTLTAALRNFTLSNSSDVFERSYQPVHFRHDLLQLSFGEKIVGTNNGLIDLCHRAFKRRDPHAPLYVKEEDLERWEKRRDITELRKKYKEHPPQSKEATKIQGRIQAIRGSLERMQVKEYRQQYFQEARKLQQRGQSTHHLYDPEARNPRRKQNKDASYVAVQVGELLVQKTFDETVPSRIVGYLESRVGDTISLENQHRAEGMKPGIKISKPRCLFGCGIFQRPSTLTTHVQTVHADQFTTPFSCPECKRMGKEDATVGIGMQAWSNHIARQHSAIDIPRPKSNTLAYCAICARSCTASGFSNHFRTHLNSGELGKPIACPGCHRQGSENPPTINNLSEWVSHLEEAHSEGCRVQGAAIVRQVTEGEVSLPRRGGKRRSEEKAGRPSKQQRTTKAGKVAAHPATKILQLSGDEDQLIEFKMELDADTVSDIECTIFELKQNAIPDPHAKEEFWVSGRDEDEMSM